MEKKLKIFNGDSEISITTAENSPPKLFDSIKDHFEESLFSEDIDSAEIEVDYCLATDFWRLPPKTKLLAKILRKRLFKIKSLILYKVEQSANAERVILFYSRTVKSDSPIKFFIPASITIQRNKNSWEVAREDIQPEESLTPWYYQEELVEYRRFLLCKDTKKPWTGKGRPPKNQKKLFIHRLSDYLNFSYSNEYYEEKDIREIINNCKSDDGSLSLEKLEKHVSVLENVCISGFIRYKYITEYNSRIMQGESEEIRTQILNLESCKSWLRIKKIADKDLLYHAFYNIILDKRFLESASGIKWKNKLRSLDPSIKKDFSNAMICISRKLDYAICDSFSFLNSHKYDKIINPREIGYKVPSEYISGSSIKNIPPPESPLTEAPNVSSSARPLNIVPSQPEEAMLGDMANYYYYCNNNNYLPYPPDSEVKTNMLYPSSLNNETNFLNSRYWESEMRQCKQFTFTIFRNLIAPINSSSFNSFGIITEEHINKSINEALAKVGYIRNGIDVSAFWTLLRSESVNFKINKFYDPNIKNICFATLFEKIQLDDVDITDTTTPLSRLCFELARLISSKLHPEYLSCDMLLRVIANALTTHDSLDYYVLRHKINIISRIQKRHRKKCLIVYTDNSLFAEKIEVALSLEKFKISNKGNLSDLYSKVAECDICMIALDFKNGQEIEITKSILKIVSSYHLLIEAGSETTFIGNAIPCEILNTFWSDDYEAINYCKYKYNDDKMNYNIMFFLQDKDYEWTAYKNLLLGFFNISPKSFKLIQCGNGHAAKRNYNSKEFLIFENLKIPLMKKILNLEQEKKPLSSDPLNFLIKIFYRFDIQLRDCSNGDSVIKIWKNFKKENKEYIKEKTFEIFMNGESNLINCVVERFPYLQRIYQVKELIYRERAAGTLDEYLNSKEAKETYPSPAIYAQIFTKNPLAKKEKTKQIGSTTA